MKLNFKRLIILLAIAVFNMNMVVAGNPGPPPPAGPSPEAPPDLPIDSGIFALLIAALFLAFYIISQRKQSIKA